MNKGELVGADTHEKLLTECAMYKDMVSANERRDKWTIKTGGVA